MNEPWKLFKVVVCFLNIPELGTCDALLPWLILLNQTVARIGAVTLVLLRTMVVGLQWMQLRPWHSMVEIHFSSTQLSCFGKVMPSKGDRRGSRGRGCHCIKWDACHFVRLCWMVVIPDTSPYHLLKWRPKKSPGTSMPLGCVQWMLLSESGDVKTCMWTDTKTWLLAVYRWIYYRVVGIIGSQYRDSYELISVMACHRGFERCSGALMSTLDS